LRFVIWSLRFIWKLEFVSWKFIFCMSFASISNILNRQLSANSGLAKQIQATLVCEEFGIIVAEKWGEKIKNKTKALYLKDNILTIASLSSVVAQEIKLNEREILEEINKKFEVKIERMRYIV
jgi:hypothetical protein